MGKDLGFSVCFEIRSRFLQIFRLFQLLMVVSRCGKALKSGIRPEFFQSGPCFPVLGLGSFKFLNIVNTRIFLKRYK